MKRKLIIILLTYSFFSCSESKTENFLNFSLEIPKKWNVYKLKGTDSYVRLITTEKNDSIHLDYGMYSNSLKYYPPTIAPLKKKEMILNFGLKESEVIFLDKDSMIWIWNTYLENNLNTRDPLVAPAFEESYEGLPPALIVSAELDPLAHEGKILAKRFIDENVPCMYFECKGLIHGFIRCRDESVQAALEFKRLTKSLSLFLDLSSS